MTTIAQKNAKSTKNDSHQETLTALEAISKVTLREFDAACLQPVQALAPEAIRGLREREHLSQAVFASYLNISKHLVSDWERGKRSQAGQL